MATRVIASFTSDVQKNCAWAISLHFLNSDNSDFDLSTGTLTGQARSAPANDSTVYANMTMTITSATGGVAVAALSAHDTGLLPAHGETFVQTTPVWAEINFVPNADPTNPICIGRGLLQVSPGGNAVQSSGSAPTVPLETINLVVGAVSAQAARQMIGVNGVDGKIPAAQLPTVSDSVSGLMPPVAKGQVPVGNGTGAVGSTVGADGTFEMFDSTTPTGRSAQTIAGAIQLTGYQQLFKPLTGDHTLELTDSATKLVFSNSATSSFAFQSSAADNSWYGCAGGRGILVATAANGTGTRVQRSVDGGKTWAIAKSYPADNQWMAVTYDEVFGQFIAVAQSGTGNRVMTSPDGDWWVARSSAADLNFQAVASWKGITVAVASSGTGQRAMYSTDGGITWTLATTPADYAWSSVAPTPSGFVAVCSDNVTNQVMTSPDGRTWTGRASGTEKNQWTRVCFDAVHDTVVAVANSGTNRAMTSADHGLTWTMRALGGNTWSSVASGLGLCVAVATSGTGRVGYSSDGGVTWNVSSDVDANAWIMNGYSGGLFFGVGNSGTGNRVMTSNIATVTVPAYATVPIPTGSPVDIRQDGSGKVWIVGEAGVTIIGAADWNARSSQYSRCRLQHTNTQNTWIVEAVL